MKKDKNITGFSAPGTSAARQLSVEEIGQRFLEKANLFDDLYASLFFDSQIPVAQLLAVKICGTGYAVESVAVQHTIPAYAEKGARLDVVAQDVMGNLHSFEFQLILHADIPKGLKNMCRSGKESPH